MQMKEVRCEQCGKHMIDTEKENKGAIAAEVQLAGFVSKLPIFYGVDDGFHFFCCKECWNDWFKTHCKHTADGDAAVAKLKADTPKVVENCVRVAQGFAKAIEIIKQRKKIQ
jgi:hypothetical protein